MSASRVGIFGLGKMGEAIVRGLQKSAEKYSICGTVRSDEKARVKSTSLGVNCHKDNLKLVAESDIIVLASKPHQAEEILRAAQGFFRPDQLLISICAALSLAKLREWSGGLVPVVRAMPNLPSFVGQGMTIFSVGNDLSKENILKTEKLLAAIGTATQIDESQMDVATAISGCGPAYVFLILEALSDAGVKLGLSRPLALELAARTLQGSAGMVLETGRHPGELKDEVTTPGGVTIEGVVALEEGNLRATLMNAVFAAAKRSAEMKK